VQPASLIRAGADQQGQQRNEHRAALDSSRQDKKATITIDKPAAIAVEDARSLEIRRPVAWKRSTWRKSERAEAQSGDRSRSCGNAA